MLTNFSFFWKLGLNFKGPQTRVFLRRNVEIGTLFSLLNPLLHLQFVVYLACFELGVFRA